MAKIVPFTLGGATALLAAVLVPSAAQQVGAWHTAIAQEQVLLGTPAASVNRPAKGDRLATPRTAPSSTVSTVEVVGLRDAAIIYRDRDGRELFRTDPVSNVTIMSKGLAIPEVTVRERSGSAVKPVPVETLNEQAQDRKTPARTRKPPPGCEPSFSPVAAPSLSHHIGRCVAELETPKLKTAWNQFTG